MFLLIINIFNNTLGFHGRSQLWLLTGLLGHGLMVPPKTDVSAPPLGGIFSVTTYKVSATLFCSFHSTVAKEPVEELSRAMQCYGGVKTSVSSGNIRPRPNSPVSSQNINRDLIILFLLCSLYSQVAYIFNTFIL